jgi:predicted HTH domain antitoxin
MSKVTLTLPDDVSTDEAKLFLALKLFELHRVSIGKAAEIAGYSKAAFMEVASKHGVAVFDYPAGELEREAAL